MESTLTTFSTFQLMTVQDFPYNLLLIQIFMACLSYYALWDSLPWPIFSLTAVL